MKAIGTSSGIALGKVLVYKEPEIIIEKKESRRYRPRIRKAR
ncbi:hypothetical protein [Schnuerera ultunensis]|uniref:Uncharacterized protein n=1 Tax=[Clostridium] ultunense Esp TaxID=1288971 RepID=A0A1M4PJ58_9FIRM|nr:hypothetical protein [Schnuerera ultunensis]SHD75486.1 protein of unknown function [[Clostridium] ultunense Esp]